MRGLTAEEADWLRRASTPLLLRDEMGARPPLDTMVYGLVDRGLIRRSATEEWIPAAGCFLFVTEITPLGRIALACHAAIKTLEAA